jgi:hypothetical protein
MPTNYTDDRRRIALAHSANSSFQTGMTTDVQMVMNQSSDYLQPSDRSSITGRDKTYLSDIKFNSDVISTQPLQWIQGIFFSGVIIVRVWSFTFIPLIRLCVNMLLKLLKWYKEVHVCLGTPHIFPFL